MAAPTLAKAAPPTGTAQPPVGGPPTIRDAFLAGYAAAGGPPELALHFVDVVIPCEDPRWDLDPVGHHAGLTQFAPETWAKAARPGADYRDPWEQGYAVGTWIGPMGVDPAGSGGWAACW